MSAQTKRSDIHPERYYHFKIEHPLISHATVFARRNKEAEGWWATVAFCSKQDQFCKQTGRNVARRKYFGVMGNKGILFQNPGSNRRYGWDISSYEKAKKFAESQAALFLPKVRRADFWEGE